MSLPQFPAILNKQITQQGYGREEGSRFAISEPASGPHFAQLLTDDVPTIFTLRMVLRGSDAKFFRAWLRSNNYAVLHGQQFVINLRTEDGMLPQVASFIPSGIPQVAIEGDLHTYTMTVLVRRVTEPSEGFEDLIVGVAEMGGAPLLQKIVNIELPEI